MKFIALALVCLPTLAVASPGAIEFSKTASGPAATTVKSTDTLYVRATLGQTLTDALKATGASCSQSRFVWSAEVDGVKSTLLVDKPSDEQFRTWTAIPSMIAIAPIPTNAPLYPSSLPKGFRDTIAVKLQAGKHEVTFTVHGTCTDTKDSSKVVASENLAAGTITLTVPAGATPRLLPKPARTDAKLVKTATALLTAKWEKDEILAVVLLDKNWTTETEFNGRVNVPTRRFTDTLVATKRPDTCQLIEVRFEQKATSTTAFGETELGSVGASRQVDCAAIR